jgi:hypothetical protein
MSCPRKKTKLKEKIDFWGENPGHFQPWAITWRHADLRPLSKNYLSTEVQVMKISTSVYSMKI